MADVEAAASGGALGELFEYKLKQPVTVRRNQSAMVPVVQHDVAVERVSLWSAARGMAQPLRAVWLTNDTGLTLDGGSLTLVEGGAFAGEGLVGPSSRARSASSPTPSISASGSQSRRRAADDASVASASPQA